MKIVIVGDGKIGSTLAQQLSQENHDITVIDREGSTLEQTAQELDILCVEGNGATQSVQMEAGVDQADLLIAATNSDELNLLCCLMAKKIGAHHTIARVRNPEYATELRLISEDLGLSLSVNPELTCATEIARNLRIPSAIKRDTFARGHVELLKFGLAPDSPLAGKALMELPALVKARVLVCAVERGEDEILYGIYLLLTATQVLFYLAGGMPLFDSLCHAFGTAGTGGFGIKADSFTSYSPYLQWVTTIFMLLFGVNFSVYFFLLRKKFDLAWKNTELRWYAAIVAGAVLLITLNTAGLDMYSGVSEAFRHAAFSVSSIITTTGYATADFNLWPEFSRMILVLLMCIGGCAGSTGGGFKVSRLIILAKSARAELRRLMHPHTVKVLTMDGKRIGQDTVQATANYLIVYVMVTVISILLISLDNFDTTTTMTSVVATFNNIGPGLGLVGPTGNYAAFSPMSKIVFCFAMLLGRLELYPMLALMLPSAWKKD